MFLFSGSAQLTEKCLALLMHIKDQNNQILTYITRQERNTLQVLPDLPTKFPLNSINDLVILDTYLTANSESASALSSYLSSLGGKDITNKTNRILKYIFTDEVAKHFNYLGQRSEKRAFSQLTLNSILIEAVKSSLPLSTNKEIEDAVKRWLKHAPERLYNIEKRQNKKKYL